MEKRSAWERISCICDMVAGIHKYEKRKIFDDSVQALDVSPYATSVMAVAVGGPLQDNKVRYVVPCTAVVVAAQGDLVVTGGGGAQTHQNAVVAVVRVG